MDREASSSRERLIATGRTKTRDLKNKKKSPSKSKKRKCLVCHKEWYLKRDYPNQRKKQNRQQGTRNVEFVSKSYDEAEVLFVTNQEAIGEWILDSSCSLHMSPNKHWFETLKIVNV